MATQIGTDQIQDSSITESKLADNALRPVDGGALSSYELTFGPEYRRKYTLAVTSNITLSLASSGHTADSWIIITATGNGSNTLFFPSDWKIKSGVYDPNVVQRIELYYDGTYVYVDIISVVDIVIATLSAAEVLGSTPTQLNLIFTAAVNISSAGWGLDSDGGAVNPGSVTGSGTNTPVFDLDREIVPGETITISYNPVVGSTTSLSGTELTQINTFAVTTEPAAPPGTSYTITVGPSGHTYTTITAANAAAVAGDRIGIYSGTYRESIAAKSGVLYEGAAGQTVIINGCDLIGTSGWTVHSGNIYKKTITLPVTGFAQTITSNTSIAANQIFRNGEMQIQARYPKAATKEDMFDLYKCRSQAQGTNLVTGTSGNQPSTAFNSTSITDTALSTGTWGSLAGGGQLFINGWFISGTRAIASHTSNTVTFSAYSNNTGINVNYRKWWFVTNKLALLTQAREWHYEGGILYFYQDGGGTPTGTLEYKARNWGIDLSNRTDVVIRNIQFFGCEVRGDTSTHRCTLDNIRGYYTNHVFMATFGVGTDESYNAQQTGFRLIGNDNTVQNSEFDFGASQCIWLGNNGKLINNKIENYGYEGNYGAGVTFWGNTSGQIVERNTFAGFGRSAIDFSMTWSGSNTNWKIRYNDLSDYCKINNDGGAIYTGRYTTTTGGEIAYNWIHNSGAQPDYENKRIEGILAALYFDQGTGPVLVHHNVFYDNWENMPTIQDRADAYILSVLGTHTNTPGSLWYNNVFGSVNSGNAWSYITYLTNPGDTQKNNIYAGTIIRNWGGNPVTGAPPGGGATLVTNSILTGTNPNYVASGAGGLYYRTSGSPALNAGVVIAGITDGYLSTNPDIGAYEQGGEDWVPGYTGPVVGGSETFVDGTTANVTYSGTWLLPQANQSGWFGGTISYSNVAGSTATFTRSTTRIKLYAERLSTHGTGTITLDGGAPVAVAFNTAPYGLQVLIWDSGTISAGSHTVVLTCTSGFVLFDYYTFV